MTVFPCRACGSTATTVRYAMRGYKVVRCRCCSSLTTAFIMDTSEAGRFYGHEYFHGGDYFDYQSTEQISKRNFAVFVKRMSQVQASGHLLELGCAYGYFLDLAKDHWSVTGVDISRAAITSCSTRHGDSVFCGDLLSLDLPGLYYDWVVAWDVIEHLNQPRAYVHRCFELLRPGGFLAVTTGDASSWVARLLGSKWRLLIPPSHLVFLSRKGISVLLEEAGYSEIVVDTIGYYRSYEFAAFRLLGSHRYLRLIEKWHRLSSLLRIKSFYLNLGDILFVLARKPES